MRLVLISDTHCHHREIALPEGDVLIHAGDFCGWGHLPSEAESFLRWFTQLPHKHKIFIAGNHDRLTQDRPDAWAEMLKRFQGDYHYLQDSVVTIEEINFYGSPWQPWFNSWAWNLERGEEINQKWKLIPNDTDVLITHGPPWGILDAVERNFGLPGEEHLVRDGTLHVGCQDLLKHLDRVMPKLHVFGHIHESYGREERFGVTYINAAICTLAYEPIHPVQTFDF